MIPGRKRRRSFFDGFFEDEFMQMEENMGKIFKDAMKSKENMPDANKPYVYGFSMRVGPDGKPRIEEFGNITGENHINTENMIEGREPLTDLIENEKDITVIAELPGIEKKDINLAVEEENMSIDVNTDTRKYHKDLDLPSKVKPETSKATYKNGVLEVKVMKINAEKKDKNGYNVKID